MLYFILMYLRNNVAPEFLYYTTTIIESFGVPILIGGAILFMFSSIIHVNISSNFLATFTNGIFKAIASLFKHLLKFFSWIAKGIEWLLKQTFLGVQKGLESKIPKWAATLFAVIATLIVLIIII